MVPCLRGRNPRTEDAPAWPIGGERYARSQVLVSFLLESLLIALAGGLLGCVLGALTNGWTASSVVGGHVGGKFVVLPRRIWQLEGSSEFQTPQTENLP
jgi:hypothetical protein